jgi:hypothetical protein
MPPSCDPQVNESPKLNGQGAGNPAWRRQCRQEKEMDGSQRRKTTGKLTPYQRIMRVAGRGQGVRLDAEEVSRLSCDDAVRRIA